VRRAAQAGYVPGLELASKLKQAEALQQFHQDQLKATIEHQRAMEGKPQIFGNPDVGYFDANAARSAPGAGPAPVVPSGAGSSMYGGLPGWKPGERPIEPPPPAVAAGPRPPVPAPAVPAEPVPQLGAGVRQLVPPRDTDFSPEARDIAARRLINGDAGALTNLGRGAQGDKRLLSVQNRAAELLVNERNMTPDDAAAHLGTQLQKFKSTQIGQNAWARTSAVREANLDLILKATDAAIPAALELNDQVTRIAGNFVPLNKIIQKGQVMTSDPFLRRFGMANLQLAEHWARAMNPTGVMRESDRDLALGFLSTADSKDTYKQTVQQLRTQIDREKAAVRGGHTTVAIPGAAREIPKDAINDLIANPGTAVKFDEWFGPGQAQRILGSVSGPR
jgi:hypothetical protein